MAPDNLAGAGKRALGGLIDLLAALAFLIPFCAVFGGLYASSDKNGGFSIQLTGIPFDIGCLVVCLLFAYLEIAFGKTPGKYLLRMRTVSEDGMKVTVKQALLRNVLRCLDYIAFIGFFIILFSKSKQRLGDLIARTQVIKETV